VKLLNKNPMQKVTSVLLVILSVSLLAFTTPKKSKIKWLTIAELNEVYAEAPKPILIDVYISKCTWCKAMETNTYGNDKVAAYINENYYAVRFNAEEKADVTFNGRVYKYNPAYKANELAIFFMLGRLGYPSTVILSNINAQPEALSGYLTPAELEAPLKYIGDGVYKSNDFTDYMKSFTNNW
jgi:thioredoxin-related protein